MGEYGAYTYGEPEDIIEILEGEGRTDQAAMLRDRLLHQPRLRGARRLQKRITEITQR
jgi:hypothetical protein